MRTRAEPASDRTSYTHRPSRLGDTTCAVPSTEKLHVHALDTRLTLLPKHYLPWGCPFARFASAAIAFPSGVENGK